MSKKILKKPPIDELKKYDAFVETDTAFQAHARLLQNKWLVFRKTTSDKLKGEANDESSNLLERGFYLLTSNIYKLVEKTLIVTSMEHASSIWSRLRSDMLSSQQLSFNMFGEMSFNLNLATEFFSKEFPNEIAEVTSVVYDYSSRKARPDWTTFDVYVEYTSFTGEERFLGIMVRYCEDLEHCDSSKATKLYQRYLAEYVRLAEASNYFKLGNYSEISQPPYDAIWRSHLLSYNMSQDSKLNRRGKFMILYPFNNDSCDSVIEQYQFKFLKDSAEDKSNFIVRDLNDFMRTIDAIAQSKWSKELIERYLVQ